MHACMLLPQKLATIILYVRALRPVSMGFHECFMHTKYSATSAKFHFLHETFRERRKVFHHGETFGTVSHALETV
jgi:hypothetical protein